jgi:hypothetical protein
MIYLASAYGGPVLLVFQNSDQTALNAFMLVAKIMSRVSIITFNYYLVKFIYPLIMNQ